MKTTNNFAPFLLLTFLVIYACGFETQSNEGINIEASHKTQNSAVVKLSGDDAGPTIELISDSTHKNFGKIALVGFNEMMLKKLSDEKLSEKDLASIVQVKVWQDSSANQDDLPPILGSYEVESGSILFKPRFSFVPGLKYAVWFANDWFLDPTASKPGHSKWTQTYFMIPKPDAIPTTFVSGVYPTSEKLPENLLKFYIHFSAPMRFGEAYQHIRLVEESGEQVQGAFLEIDQELWDAANQRFTLLFDPGRIKRELKPHLEEGLALQAGKSYELVISADWRDAKGYTLKKEFRKKFSIIEADRVSPNHQNWKFTLPHKGSSEPVKLDFPEPLDHALLHRMLVVLKEDSTRMEGEVVVSKHERRWEFVPVKPWQTGRYFIRVNTLLEDLAGNSLRNVFDVDMQHDRPVVNSELVSIPFNIDE